MKTILDKMKLMDIVRENMNKHEDIFKEAVEGFRKEAVKRLENYITEIKTGSLKRVYVSLPVPENHTSDYKRVLEMIKRHEDEVIELTEQDFASYVLDDWEWKRAFLTSNSLYSVTAAAMAVDEEEEWV